MNLELRQLRYFVAVAEELNFTRAAARLHIAQQSLSAQIRVLEREVGGPLLERSTRHVRLTTAGRHLYTAAGALLADADAALTSTRAVAAGGSRLVVGFVDPVAFELIPAVARAHTERHPEVNLALHDSSYDDPTGGLHSNEADIAYVLPPFSATGLELRTLFTVAAVAALPAGHRLAGQGGLRLDQLLDEAWCAPTSNDPVWRDLWSAAAARTARPGRTHPAARVVPVRTVEEVLQTVAGGRAVSVVSASAQRFYSRPGITYVPVVDLPPFTAALAWRGRDRRAEIAQYVDIATAMCATTPLRTA